MIRILLTAIVWSVIASAATEGFTFAEKRYLYSVDKTLHLSGQIRFEGGGMQIDYTQPEQRRIVYGENRLKVYGPDGGLKEEIDLDEQPGMKLHMQFLLWLYRGDFDALQSYFTLERHGDELHLIPIPPTDKVVASVKVLMASEKPRVIKTVMSNRNEITIDIAR